MCTGKLCYPLHSSWVSRVGVPLTSRHLLCVYVCRVLRLCRLVPGRVVLCVPVCCATHCMVHVIGGYVCITSRHLLYMYVSRVLRLCCLVPGRVVLCVAVCCATHCMVQIGGYVCHLLRGTCSVCTLAECYGCAVIVQEQVVLCVQYTVLPIALYLGFAGLCATHFGAPALCVRLPCATAVPPCAWTCRTVCRSVLCYTLHGTWDSRICVPLNSRHLL